MCAVHWSPGGNGKASTSRADMPYPWPHHINLSWQFITRVSANIWYPVYMSDKLSPPFILVGLMAGRREKRITAESVPSRFSTNSPFFLIGPHSGRKKKSSAAWRTWAFSLFCFIWSNEKLLADIERGLLDVAWHTSHAIFACKLCHVILSAVVLRRQWGSRPRAPSVRPLFETAISGRPELLYKLGRRTEMNKSKHID